MYRKDYTGLLTSSLKNRTWMADDLNTTRPILICKYGVPKAYLSDPNPVHRYNLKFIEGPDRLRNCGYSRSLSYRSKNG